MCASGNEAQFGLPRRVGGWCRGVGEPEPDPQVRLVGRFPWLDEQLTAHAEVPEQ
jgi:hypothetical protein